ncbi:MAG TPA: hypothetical protein DCL55_03935, partial [Brevundimonas sp.]|nr:hypothetical protein [Brevundimonas sp.]
MLLKRKYLFGTTILAGVMMASAPALAQDAGQNQQDPQARETTVEEIVVTGSRIARPSISSPVPLTSVTAGELTDQGDISLGDALNDLPSLRTTFSQGNS